MNPIRIMFVCLGNICRSPLAEAILKHKVKSLGLENQFEIQSSGTADYHVGEDPDPRTLQVAKERGVSIDHKGQQFKRYQLEDFDYIIVMDAQNLLEVTRVAGYHSNKMIKMRYYDPGHQNENVPDPWYGSFEDFEDCFDLLDRCCDQLLNNLINKG
jgi:protein-tyrosine phosphatase